MKAKKKAPKSRVAQEWRFIGDGRCPLKLSPDNRKKAPKVVKAWATISSTPSKRIASVFVYPTRADARACRINFERVARVEIRGVGR